MNVVCSFKKAASPEYYGAETDFAFFFEVAAAVIIGAFAWRLR